MFLVNFNLLVNLMVVVLLTEFPAELIELIPALVYLMQKGVQSV